MQTHGRLLLSLAVAVAALLVLVGCGGASSLYGGASKSSTPSAGAGGAVGTRGKVSIQNFAFTPQTLTVKVGAKVTWTNNDSVSHNVTSSDGPGVNAGTTSMFASSNLNPGQSFTFTFTKAGTYYYECTIHKAMPSMHARVVVT